MVESVNETETETGVLCLICIIHNLTLLTETALERGDSSTKISLRGLATQVLNPDSQLLAKNAPFGAFFALELRRQDSPGDCP